VSAADVDATIRYLIPRFIAIKVFTFFGLPGRRTDLELTLWSLLVAAFINAGIDRRPSLDLNGRLVLSSAAAVLVGVVLSRAWLVLSARQERLRAGAARGAWDLVLSRASAPWVQCWVSDGRIVTGWPQFFALAAETDVLDLYLRDPQWVDPATQARSPMAGIEGVLIPRDSIQFIQVFGAAGS
jgi:hypothetical protein